VWDVTASARLCVWYTSPARPLLLDPVSLSRSQACAQVSAPRTIHEHCLYSRLSLAVDKSGHGRTTLASPIGATLLQLSLDGPAEPTAAVLASHRGTPQQRVTFDGSRNRLHSYAVVWDNLRWRALRCRNAPRREFERQLTTFGSRIRLYILSDSKPRLPIMNLNVIRGGRRS
jgi:hypothetical protein